MIMHSYDDRKLFSWPVLEREKYLTGTGLRDHQILTLTYAAKYVKFLQVLGM
jgi:hypothetical protein